MDMSKLKKVELHCHLDGSLSLDFMKRASEISDAEEIRKRASVLEDYHGSLTEYLTKFDLPIVCLNTKEHIFKAAKGFLEEAARENVIYTEVRYSPVLLETENLSLRDVTESVIEGLRAGEKVYGVHFGVLLCAMRHHSTETNLRVVRQAKEFLGAGVCGLDLAGDESGFPTSRFAEVFKAARDENIPFTMHAGECGNPLEIKTALEFGAKRIGHGIAMQGRPDIQELCLKNHIGIEMCPISNYQTGAVKWGSAYPAREFLDKGLLVTVNTDNRTVSSTNLTKEIAFLTKRCGVSDDEILQMQRNAIECSFVGDAVKEELLRSL